MTLFHSLRNRPFAYLLGGQTVSRLGDSLYRVALAWWVLEKTGSAAAMGTLLVFASVPQLIFLLIGGVAGDRYPRSLILLLSDGLRGCVVGVVALLASLGRLEVWHVYLASLSFGFVSAFFEPAYMAILPELVPVEDRPSANSLTALSMRLSGIVGPGIGATVVALGGTWFAFTLDALSFMIAAVAVLPILGRGWNLVGRDQPHSALVDLHQGFGFVKATPWLWISIVVFGFANFAQAGPMVVLLPVLVKNDLHLGVETLGATYSAASIGATLGALWLGGYKRLPRRGWLFYAFAICISLSVAGVGLTVYGRQNIWATVAVLLSLNFINGLSHSGAGLSWNTLLQDKIPREMLGRVASIDALGSLALLPLGFGAAGWIAEGIGSANTLILGGFLSAAATAMGLFHPNIRQLD